MLCPCPSVVTGAFTRAESRGNSHIKQVQCRSLAGLPPCKVRVSRLTPVLCVHPSSLRSTLNHEELCVLLWCCCVLNAAVRLNAVCALCGCSCCVVSPARVTSMCVPRGAVRRSGRAMHPSSLALSPMAWGHALLTQNVRDRGPQRVNHTEYDEFPVKRAGESREEVPRGGERGLAGVNKVLVHGGCATHVGSAGGALCASNCNTTHLRC